MPGSTCPGAVGAGWVVGGYLGESGGLVIGGVAGVGVG